MRILFRFWSKVFLRAICSTWEFTKEHVWFGLILLASFLTVSYFSASGAIDQAIKLGYMSDVASYSRFLAGLSFFTIFWVFMNLAYQPAKMYEELGGLIENPLRFITKEPEYSHVDQLTCVSIEIHNNSKYTIENCYLRIKRDSMQNLEQLSWSVDNPNPINQAEYSPVAIYGDVRLRCDVAIAWLKEANAVIPSLRDRVVYPGTHYITVFANGNWKNMPLEHSENFILIYEGENKLSLRKI